MKRLLLPAALLVLNFQTQAQYTITDSHTASELLNEISGENVITLNPVLSCGDTSNGIFSGTGSFDFDNGIILTTNNALDITPFLYGTPAYPEEKMYTDLGMDEDMNAYLLDSGYTHTEAYNACILEFDIIPQTPKIQIDYIFAASMPGGFGGWGGCDPGGDLPVIFIKGGDEFPAYINIATYPGTTVPVRSESLDPGAEILVPEGCSYYEGAPYVEYFVDNEFGTYADIDYRFFSKQLPATANVTPCDTYHLKLAIADIRSNAGGFGAYGSSLIFKTSSLEGVGQPIDCTTGISEYLKQQSKIKVSPNPFNCSLAIAIEDANQGEFFTVSLTDLQGRVLNNYSGDLTIINNRLKVAGEQLSPGMYLLNIKSESGKYNHAVKVIKQ